MQNPRTYLSVVSSLTDPSPEREASCRRIHWAAVSNPRISVWSIVAKSPPPSLWLRAMLSKGACGNKKEGSRAA